MTSVHSNTPKKDPLDKNKKLNEITMNFQTSGVRNSKKRKQEQPNTTSEPFQVLVADKPIQIRAASNVAENSKVKQYLARLNTESDGEFSACIKFILCDSEIEQFDIQEQENLEKEFELESMYISESTPRCVDRIVTLHGDLNKISRCVLYITFLMRSRVNNMLKCEPFTLKSSNYQLAALIEADDLSVTNLAEKFPLKSIDTCQYDRNLGLQIATLSGDFLSLFKSLTYIFRRFVYLKYASDEDVEILPILNVHDGDFLHSGTGESHQSSGENNKRILTFVYNRSSLHEATEIRHVTES